MRISSIFESQSVVHLSDKSAAPLFQVGQVKDLEIYLNKVNPDFFVHRPNGLDENLPWDFIDHGITKEHLIKEYKLALKGEESDTCRVGDCTRCGVCAQGRGRE